jgi:hypothetical protein
MEQEKIERINALARLARERALTAEEAAQQSALRQEIPGGVAPRRGLRAGEHLMWTTAAAR